MTRIPWNKGKKLPPFSDEWRKNIGLAHKGKILTEEHKKKISLALKGRLPSSGSFKKGHTTNVDGRTLCSPCHRKTPTWGIHKGQGIVTTLI